MDKSILILSVPRSGTTSLLYSFEKSFKVFDEPLNTFMRKEYTTKEFFELIKQKGIAIKSMTDHIPYDYTGDHISFLSKIIPYFNHVILLDRKDCNAQKKSYERIIDDTLKRNKKFTYKTASNLIKFLYLQKYLLREISDDFDLDITYYEDLFYSDSKTIFTNLKIDHSLIDFSILDPKNRYSDNIHFEKPKTLL